MPSNLEHQIVFVYLLVYGHFIITFLTKLEKLFITYCKIKNLTFNFDILILKSTSKVIYIFFYGKIVWENYVQDLSEYEIFDI